MTTLTLLKIILAFVNGMAGLIAAFPGPELGVMERLLAAAVVAGCGPALLLLNPPGRASRSLDPADMTMAQRRRLAMKLKDEMMRLPAEAPHG